MNDKKIELTEAAIEAWRDDIDFRCWKERAIELMRAGLPSARLRKAAEAAVEWWGSDRSVDAFRAKWVVTETVFCHDFVVGLLTSALAEAPAVPTDQSHIKDIAYLPRQMTEEELCAVTEDVARLTKERDEARAILDDLQATNIAMQQDRDGLHQRIEELQADFDEAIQQRDQAQAQVESLKKQANVGALMRQVVDRTASAKWEARARVLAGMVHELIGGA